MAAKNGGFFSKLFPRNSTTSANATTQRVAKPAPVDAEAPLRVGGVGKETTYEAAERTNLPLNGYMTRLMAQELPILDSTSRQRVNELLRQWEGPEITSVEELPEEVRQILELY